MTLLGLGKRFGVDKSPSEELSDIIYADGIVEKPEDKQGIVVFNLGAVSLTSSSTALYDRLVAGEKVRVAYHERYQKNPPPPAGTDPVIGYHLAHVNRPAVPKVALPVSH